MFVCVLSVSTPVSQNPEDDMVIPHPAEGGGATFGSKMNAVSDGSVPPPTEFAPQYENVSDSVKADIFGFDIADVSGSIRLFLDVMKKLGIKLDGDGLYEEFQRIYDEAVNRDVDKGKAEDKIWNKGRGR